MSSRRTSRRRRLAGRQVSNGTMSPRKVGGHRVLTFHLEVVCLRNVEQVIAVCDLELVRLPFLVYYGDVTSVSSLVSAIHPSPSPTAAYYNRPYSSPGFGFSRCPCRAVAAAEKGCVLIQLGVRDTAPAHEALELWRDVQEGVVCHRLATCGGHAVWPSTTADTRRVTIGIRRTSRLDMAIVCRDSRLQERRCLYITSASSHAALVVL